MSNARFLVLFTGDHEEDRGWLRLADGDVLARGRGLPPPANDDDSGERVVLVVPGEDVAIHRADLPGLTEAQAQAAGRLLASEISATPIDRLHVAVGPEGEGGVRALALVDTGRMSSWVAGAQAAGFDPDHVLPDPMLIAPPGEGATLWERGDRWIVRGDTLALAADPAVAAIATEHVNVARIDDGAVERSLGDVLADPALDLRQGAFARRRRWRIDWAAIRRMVVIAGLILLAILATQLALILRYSLAADALEAETATVAQRALPEGAGSANPQASLDERLAAARGGGLGFAASSGILFGAVRDTPNAELSSLSFAPDGALRATVMADDPATIAALVERIGAGGLTVESGGARAGAGRQVAELTMRAR